MAGKKKGKDMKAEHEKIIAEYIQELKLQGRPFKTIKSNLKIFFLFIENAGIDFLRMKIRDAQDFQMHLSTEAGEDGNIRYSRGSVVSIIGSVTAFYDYLRRKKLIFSNPFLEIKRISPEKRLPKNILNEEKMDALLRNLRQFGKGKGLYERRGLYKAHVIAELMYSCGARINEIAGLKPSDIDFLRGLARIKDSKSGRYRDVIINEYASKVLTVYIKAREYILFGQNNGDTSLLFGSKFNLQIRLNALLNEESKKLGFGRFTSHHFRHALGYHLLRNGCDIRYIQEILGHRFLNTTQVYTKVDKEDLKGVIDEYHPRRMRSLYPSSSSQDGEREKS